MKRWIIALLLVVAGASVTTLLAAQPETDTHVDHASGTAAGEPAHGTASTAGHEDGKGTHGEGTHGEGHAAEGAHAGGHHGPEPINWTDLSDKHRPAFIALLINFGILVGLYYTLGKKPIAAGLKQRRVDIAKAIEEAAKLLNEAESRAKQYQGNLKNVDAEAATAKATIVSAGKGEVERLLSETEERAARMERDAERLVDQERKQLQQDLLVETVGIAVERAQKILEKSTTPEDHARLANELLAELARKPAAARSVAPRGAA